MHSLFSDKVGKVMVVHAIDAVRLKMQQTLKGLGFSNIETRPNLHEARRTLANTKIDWVLTTYNRSDKETAISLLEYIGRERAEQNIYVSLFVNEDENSALPLAYMLGILSHHRCYFENDTLRAGIMKLLDVAQKFEFDASLVAASYFRPFLLEQKKTKSLVNLEENLFLKKPERPELLLSLAEAQFLAGMTLDAGISLSRAKEQSPTLGKEANRIKAEYASVKGPTLPTAKEFNIFTVAVIDPDEGVHMSVRGVLSQMGVPTIQSFYDGASAWEWIKKTPGIDLVIMEWKLPKLTGPFLIQRIRQNKHAQFPIVVCSSLVKEEDVALLDEFFVSKTFFKPVDSSKLLSILQWCKQQENKPTELNVSERKIIDALKQNLIEPARKLQVSYNQNIHATQARKNYVEALFKYFEKDFARARDLLQVSTDQVTRDTLPMVNLLGRSLLQLGEFKQALRYFQKAIAINPRNIERLCDISEAYLYLDEIDNAKKNLNLAEGLDGQNDRVLLTKAKQANVPSKLGISFSVINQINDLSELVSYLNNFAIAKIRSGEREQGLEIYEKVLNALPENDFKNRSRVSYNLGLGYVRDNNLKQAAEVLKNVNGTEKGVSRKARSLLNRVNTAMTNATPVVLNENSVDEFGDEFEADVKAVETASSQASTENPTIAIAGFERVMCLRGIFSYQKEFDELSLKS